MRPPTVKMEVTCTGVNGGGSEIVAAASSGSTAVGDGTEAVKDAGMIADGVDGVDGASDVAIVNLNMIM